MKITVKESLEKDKKYLEEILELYNRNIFSDYIIGMHLMPNKENKVTQEELVEIAEKLIKDDSTHIKGAYVNRDNLVVFIPAYKHPFSSRLQDILSFTCGKVNSQLKAEQDTFLYGHIFGFRNLVSALKLMMTIYRENNTITKKEWLLENAPENFNFSGNLLRDEMKIAAETGKGFETILKEDLNGIYLDQNANKTIPSFNFNDTMTLLQVLENKFGK